MSRRDERRSGTAARGGANERFKRGARGWFWGGMVAAVGVHFLVFWFSPSWTVPEWRTAPTEDALESVELVPRVEVPPPPDPVRPPAVPVVADVGIDLDEHVTIEPVTFEDDPAMEIPTPSVEPLLGPLEHYRHIAPYMVAPELKNPDEVRERLEREYPARLARRGAGGRAILWFWIDRDGTVQKYEMRRSSGHALLDEAALRVIDVMEFSPALNGEHPVPVIVALPIVFEAP